MFERRTIRNLIAPMFAGAVVGLLLGYAGAWLQYWGESKYACRWNDDLIFFPFHVLEFLSFPGMELARFLNSDCGAQCHFGEIWSVKHYVALWNCLVWAILFLPLSGVVRMVRSKHNKGLETDRASGTATQP
jgi:hypothetical protein